MILEIRKFGDPVLERKAEPVTEFGDELKALVDDMFETMYAAPGVGLAAPQVGVSKRLFVMDCSSNRDAAERQVLVNPEIRSREGREKGDEGCLSFPGIFFEVERAERIVVRAQNLDGEWFELDATGLTSRCVQHENDHLDGVLFIEHLSALRRDLVRRKIRRRQKAGDW
jgi:peptide deformylase